jgi:hypothetical protein
LGTILRTGQRELTIRNDVVASVMFNLVVCETVEGAKSCLRQPAGLRESSRRSERSEDLR